MFRLTAYIKSSVNDLVFAKNVIIVGTTLIRETTVYVYLQFKYEAYRAADVVRLQVIIVVSSYPAVRFVI